jgi:acetyl esterase/lipase
MDIELSAIVPLIPDLPFSDVEGTRRDMAAMMAGYQPDLAGVLMDEHEIAGPDDSRLTLRIFRPEAPESGRPMVVDIHGGGFAMGSASLDDTTNIALARDLGCVVASVEYRLAPEHPFPAGANDCYAALTWVAEHGAEWGGDVNRIALIGESAGACLAATTALFARDRGGPAVSMLVMLEPEIDDRMATDSMVNGSDTVAWDNKQGKLSWEYYLGEHLGDPPLHAAPARTEDLHGLPPTYVTVNELDCLRDEGLEFASRLMQSGVSTELHCWSGTYHGFRVLGPDTGVARTANALLMTAIRRVFDIDIAIHKTFEEVVA